MPQHRERIRIGRVARRQDLDRLAVRERQAQVLDAPVLADQHRLLGQLGADRACGVEAGRAVRKFEFRRVGKKHLHDRPGCSAPAGDDRNDEADGTPVPDPEEETGDAEDVPTAD